MASGNFGFNTSNQYVVGNLSWWESDQKPSENVAYVNAEVTLSRTNTGYTTGSSNTSFTITINGVPVNTNSGGTVINVTYNSNTVVATARVPVTHDSDGSKSIDISVEGSMPYANLTAPKQTKTVILDTIPRASAISTTSPYFNSGYNNVTIMIGKMVESYTSDLEYIVGNLTGVIVKKTSESMVVWDTISIDYDFKRFIPDKNKDDVIIRCFTYNEKGELVGQTYTTIECRIIDGPVINSIVFDDTNPLTKALTLSTEENPITVKSYSNAKFTVEATIDEYATIKSYSVTNGEAKSGNVASNVVTVSNVQNFYDEDGLKTKYTIRVTDGRGNFTEQDKITNFINYEDVAFINTNVTFKRENQTSNKVRLTANGVFFNGLFRPDVQNDITITYKYREKGTTEYIDGTIILSPPKDGNTFRINGVVLNEEFSYLDNWEFQLFATDLIKTSEPVSKMVPPGETLVKWYKNGADFKELKIKGQLVQANPYPVGALYFSIDPTNPTAFFGGTWVPWGTGRVPVAVDTSQAEFNTVEKTGGHKLLQNHSHPFGAWSLNSNSAYGGQYQGILAGYPPGWSTIIKQNYGYSGDTGILATGDGNAQNLQPYITCYIWKRVKDPLTAPDL